MTRRRLLLAAAATVLVAGCGAVPAPAPAADPATGKNVVVVSAEGKLATSTPVGATTRVPPTPTFDPGFGSVLTPLAGTPTAAALELQRSPTPEIRPTRTPAPTFTPFPTIEVPPLVSSSADGTPTAAGASSRPPGTPTRVPTATPIDPFERGGKTNNDLATATVLKLNTDVKGLLNGPDDADVYKLDVTDDSQNLQVVVMLTGQDMDSYRVFLITPGRRTAAYGTQVGTVARHIVFPVRGEVGTWYVEVTSQSGKRAPRGTYTLNVTTRSLSEPSHDPSA
ncbi:MAG TPA: hypothetical protein VGM69_23740 [Chloroflexota bacterium]|jgi:hypothetical protein